MLHTFNSFLIFVNARSIFVRLRTEYGHKKLVAFLGTMFMEWCLSSLSKRLIIDDPLMNDSQNQRAVKRDEYKVTTSRLIFGVIIYHFTMSNFIDFQKDCFSGLRISNFQIRGHTHMAPVLVRYIIRLQLNNYLFIAKFEFKLLYENQENDSELNVL